MIAGVRVIATWSPAAAQGRLSALDVRPIRCPDGVVLDGTLAVGRGRLESLIAVERPMRLALTVEGHAPFVFTLVPGMSRVLITEGTTYRRGDAQTLEASFSYAPEDRIMQPFVRPSGVIDPLDPIGSVLGYPVWPSPGVWGTAGRQVSTNPAPAIPPPGPMGTGQAPAVTPTPGATAPAPVAAAPVAPSTSWVPWLLGGAVVVGGGYLLTRKGRK